VGNAVVNVDIAARGITREAGRSVATRVNLKVVADDCTIARGVKAVTDRSRGVQPRVVDVDHSVGSIRVNLSSSVMDGDIDIVKVGSGGISLKIEMSMVRTSIQSQ
jgi:hypothetical protein